MSKVFIAPHPSEHAHEGGILRVIQAQLKHLPAFGWECVDKPSEAYLICSHGVWTVEGYEHIPVVQCNHGLMWSDYFAHRWDDVNEQLVRAMKRADAVVAPSRWVANAIARGIAVDPVVIHHGVDVEEWEAMPSQGYVLWNKARGDEVSDYHEVEKLAALMPDVQFVSTIGTATANLKICGVRPYAEMKRIIQSAGVYLATARETFGIGTLEAMASGVPVAGWDYGGQSNIIVQGETGYLANYGDYSKLATAVRRCLTERDRLADNCRRDIQDRWGWQPRIAEYARLFQTLVDKQGTPKVSVIVTSFNLARFLPEALQSVLNQTMTDWECIIVDDASADDTTTLASEWENKDERFKLFIPSHNLGLPVARNYGIARASGKYIIPLDADDMLAPDALQVLSEALDKDKSLHIAYGHLELMSEDGKDRRATGWGVHSFDYSGQLNHHNQLHYSAMMRRSVFERTQGYRRRSWQAEDAELWGYLSSFGFNIQRVTAKPTLIYRLRSGSKSSTNNAMGTQWSDGDWSAWYTWRERVENTPFGAQGIAPATLGKFWNVPHNAEPEVSIIVPVGKGHETVLQDALDSILAQTFTRWELVIVNDTGQPLDLRGYSFATVVNTDGGKGAGFARNSGVAQANAPLLVFLDADDFLQPAFLEAAIAAYRAESTPALIYTDWYVEQGQGDNRKVWSVSDWDWRLFANKGQINCVTCLIPKAAHLAIGGFDETLVGYEDSDYFMRLAFIGGLCGKRIPLPLMTYRMQLGQRNNNAVRNHKALQDELYTRYSDYLTGRRAVACQGCGGGRAKALPQMQSYNPLAGVSNVAPPAEGMVLMEYMGESTTTLRYEGKVTQSGYRFAASDSHRRKYVYAEDVPDLLTKTIPHRPGVALFVAAEEARPVSNTQPLAIKDRVPPPTVQRPVEVAPQMTPIEPRIVGPLPQAILPAMPVQPIPKPQWQIEEERAKAAQSGVVLPSMPRRDAGIPVADVQPIEVPMPMVATSADVPLESPMPAYVPPAIATPAELALISIVSMSYNQIRLALDTMTLEQKREAYRVESVAVKPRQGVLKLIKTHLDAKE